MIKKEKLVEYLKIQQEQCRVESEHYKREFNNNDEKLMNGAIYAIECILEDLENKSEFFEEDDPTSRMYETPDGRFVEFNKVTVRADKPGIYSVNDDATITYRPKDMCEDEEWEPCIMYYTHTAEIKDE